MVGDADKKKILVVDDDPLMVALLVKTLENFGFEIIKGSNGQEALNLVKQYKIDLIILDKMMPKMDGIKACALIKADKRFCDIPIIILTASADAADKNLGEEVGANAFCNKPLNPALLHQKILELLKLK